MELAALYEYEHDAQVLEFYDQPPSLKLVYEAKHGRHLGVWHTPDYFVVRADAIGWEEWKTVADAIQVAGAGRVLTMDLHAGQIQGFFQVPVDNLYALPVFVAEVQKWVASGVVERPVMVAPDAGAGRLVRDYVRRLSTVGAGMAIGDKVRAYHDERSEVAVLLGDVRGRDAILVDDVIFTGGSVANMALTVHEPGARSIRAIVTHGLFYRERRGAATRRAFRRSGRHGYSSVTRSRRRRAADPPGFSSAALRRSDPKHLRGNVDQSALRVARTVTARGQECP